MKAPGTIEYAVEAYESEMRKAQREKDLKSLDRIESEAFETRENER